MDWMEQLEQRLLEDDAIQLSIDGQIWTVQQDLNGYKFSNPYGRQEHFATSEELMGAIQSWYENPVLVVL
ncbi:hypothetical protein [Tumebacillus lipolyticus]|uniref:Uncharacterized protein n=1 Tax=Tumebacillus lipolyticus TaxID=1280370 RepID=A0ABW4ZXY5_9BACL